LGEDLITEYFGFHMSKLYRELMVVRNGQRKLFPADPFDVGLGSYSLTRPDYLIERGFIQSKKSPKRAAYRNWQDLAHYTIKCGESKRLDNVAVVLPSDDSREAKNRLTFYDLRIPWWGEEVGSAMLEVNGCPIRGLPSLARLTESEGIVIDPPETLDDMIVHSLKVMLPHVKSDLSLINSLIELKDFKSVKHSLIDLKKLFKGVFTQSKTASLRQLLQSTADGYLQAKFNFIPLWSDIVGIHAAISKCMKRLGVHINAAGRPLTAHYHKQFEEYSEPELETLPSTYVAENLLHVSDGYNSGTATVFFIRAVEYFPTQFHAEVQYNANYSAFQIAHAQGLTLLDQLGVNLNPQIVWNAIPWSFVVDWFFNVGEWLSRMTQSNMAPQINVMQYLWSVKRRRRIRISAQVESVSFHPETSNDGIEVFTYPMVEETAYYRKVGLPDASSFLTSGLNLTEFSLGAALVITRKRHSKTHSRT